VRTGGPKRIGGTFQRKGWGRALFIGEEKRNTKREGRVFLGGSLATAGFTKKGLDLCTVENKSRVAHGLALGDFSSRLYRLATQWFGRLIKEINACLSP